MAVGTGRVTTRRNSDGTVTISTNEVFDRPEYWAWLRQQIVERQQWVAQRVGIEQIGYLTDIKPPDRVLTLAQAVEVYATFAKVSRDEHASVRRAWDEFSGIIGIVRIKDINHTIAET